MSAWVGLSLTSSINSDLRIPVWQTRQGRHSHSSLGHCYAWIWGPEMQLLSCRQPKGKLGTRNKETGKRVSTAMGSTLSSGWIHREPHCRSATKAHSWLLCMVFCCLFAESINDKCGHEILVMFTFVYSLQSTSLLNSHIPFTYPVR